METLALSSGAEADLEALQESGPDALAAVVAFLEEADADPDLINKCTTKGNVQFGATQVNVKPWAAARRTDNNLFRIRVLDTPATVYRIVYGFDWHSRRVCVLAVVHKDDFDYELCNELAVRIQDDWHTATDGRYT
jgi:mRNA-degrading endonuclease RelE of RelBE toxin-antitoxin system